ncbi:MAG: hypothetical protein HQL69_19485 [Magnetococcales bacterium]|nr:hypothetical protein [Magnetococcales bacterium]
MPVEEIIAVVPAGETMTVTGPGVLEFKIPKVAAATMQAGAAGKGAAATGTAAAAGTNIATGAGGVSGVGQSAVVAGSTSAKSVTASLLNGKVMGLSLGAVNPWILLGVGALGGYYYFKKKSIFNF